MDYKSALKDAINSSSGIASYDTELLLGGICQKMGLDDIAESHYKEASLMCPSRIIPLYRLFKLYEERNDTASVNRIGTELLNKPIKVHSHDTRTIRLEVRRKLMGL